MTQEKSKNKEEYEIECMLSFCGGGQETSFKGHQPIDNGVKWVTGTFLYHYSMP